MKNISKKLAKKIDKILRDEEKIILDIGCGKIKRGNVGIDLFPNEVVDIVYDVNNGIPFPENSIDKILMFHSLEHTKDPVYVLEECHRVLKKNGILHIKVPHHTNPSAYEIQHKIYCNYFSFLPLCRSSNKSSEAKRLFDMFSININLMSIRNPLYLFKWLIKIIIKKKPLIYEKYLSYLFPAYEIENILKKI